MNSLKKENLKSSPLFPLVSEVRASKVYGNHVEINLLLQEQKVCSYDCSYCDLGKTTTKINAVKNLSFPPVASIIREIQGRLNETILSGKKIECLLISGNGEASLHPQFHEVSKSLKQWIDENASDIQLTLLTNGAHFVTKKALSSTQFYDDIFLKIDCADDITLKKMNSPIVRQSLQKILFSAQKIENLSVQTMFVHGAINNTTEDHFEDLIEVLGMLKPKKLLLTTIKKPINGLEPTDDMTIYSIAQKLKKRIQSQIFIDL